MWNRKRRGVTLIELLIAVTLSTIIATAVATIFNACMEAWRFGDEMASIEAVLPPLVNRVSEGDYTHPGFVDALLLTQASSDRIEFVPLILDYFKPDHYLNPDQTFVLTRPFLSGSPAPKGQIQLKGETLFRNVAIEFYPGEETDPPVDYNEVHFVELIPKGAAVRVIYRPDHHQDPQTIMTVRWDPSTQAVTREYFGETEELSGNTFGVSFTDLHFQLFNNANTPVTSSADNKYLSEQERNTVTAIRTEATAVKGDTTKTESQFINMRNLGWASSGYVIQEGSEMTLPVSKIIRSFSIVNISGITSEKGLVELEIESNYGQSWGLTLAFGLVEDNPLLLDYKIQYPVGKTVLERAVFQPISKGFDLLSIDEEGRYDYDADEGVDDEIEFDDEPITLRVTRMDIAGAAIYIRP